MTRPRPLELASLLALVALAALPGCGEAEAQEPVEVGLADLPCASDPADGDLWETAPFPPATDGETCAWLAYESDTTYRIAHPLGRVPRAVHAYVSFHADGRSSTPLSGDVTHIVSVTDTAVEIRNGQGADFFLRLVVE